MCEFIDNSKISDIDKAKGKNFIMNEGSDYEILTLAVRGQRPTEKYNIVEEKKLFEDIKNCVSKNSETFNKLLSEKVAKDFAKDLTPLSEYGLTSCVPIMNFIIEQQVWGNVQKAARAERWKGVDAGIAKLRATNDMYAKNKKFSKQVGGALLAAMIAYAAYKIYKNKFSAAAKACKGKTGPEKTLCMNNFKVAAIKAQIAQLKSGSSGCNSSKDPVKCKAVILAKIKKLEGKLK
jgi:hypothetical protein